MPGNILSKAPAIAPNVTRRAALAALAPLTAMPGWPVPPASMAPAKSPDITSGKAGIGSWSAAEIASYLENGFTPDYDSVGGAMVEVQANMAKLTPADRAAIAAYLKAVPPR